MNGATGIIAGTRNNAMITMEINPVTMHNAVKNLPILPPQPTESYQDRPYAAENRPSTVEDALDLLLPVVFRQPFLVHFLLLSLHGLTKNIKSCSALPLS